MGSRKNLWSVLWQDGPASGEGPQIICLLGSRAAMIGPPSFRPLSWTNLRGGTSIKALARGGKSFAALSIRLVSVHPGHVAICLAARDSRFSVVVLDTVVSYPDRVEDQVQEALLRGLPCPGTKVLISHHRCPIVDMIYKQLRPRALHLFIMQTDGTFFAWEWFQEKHQWIHLNTYNVNTTSPHAREVFVHSFDYAAEHNLLMWTDNSSRSSQHFLWSQRLTFRADQLAGKRTLAVGCAIRWSMVDYSVCRLLVGRYGVWIVGPCVVLYMSFNSSSIISVCSATEALIICRDESAVKLHDDSAGLFCLSDKGMLTNYAEQPLRQSFVCQLERCSLRRPKGCTGKPVKMRTPICQEAEITVHHGIVMLLRKRECTCDFFDMRTGRLLFTRVVPTPVQMQRVSANSTHSKQGAAERMKTDGGHTLALWQVAGDGHTLPTVTGLWSATHLWEVVIDRTTADGIHTKWGKRMCTCMCVPSYTLDGGQAIEVEPYVQNDPHCKQGEEVTRCHCYCGLCHSLQSQSQAIYDWRKPAKIVLRNRAFLQMIISATKWGRLSTRVSSDCNTSATGDKGSENDLNTRLIYRGQQFSPLTKFEGIVELVTQLISGSDSEHCNANEQQVLRNTATSNLCARGSYDAMASFSATGATYAVAQIQAQFSALHRIVARSSSGSCHDTVAIANGAADDDDATMTEVLRDPLLVPLHTALTPVTPIQLSAITAFDTRIADRVLERLTECMFMHNRAEVGTDAAESGSSILARTTRKEIKRMPTIYTSLLYQNQYDDGSEVEPSEENFKHLREAVTDTTPGAKVMKPAANHMYFDTICRLHHLSNMPPEGLLEFLSEVEKREPSGLEFQSESDGDSDDNSNGSHSSNNDEKEEERPDWNLGQNGGVFQQHKSVASGGSEYHDTNEGRVGLSSVSAKWTHQSLSARAAISRSWQFSSKTSAQMQEAHVRLLLLMQKEDPLVAVQFLTSGGVKMPEVALQMYIDRASVVFASSSVEGNHVLICMFRALVDNFIRTWDLNRLNRLLEYKPRGFNRLDLARMARPAILEKPGENHGLVSAPGVLTFASLCELMCLPALQETCD